jgi:oligopeptide/dipeptide ABC transporter ATP-binding protein
MTARGKGQALLEARDVAVRFHTTKGTVHALDGISLTVRRGETVGLVGESGSGKSTLAMTLMRAVTPDEGSIAFDGQDISRLKPKALKPVRRHLQMIFQDPYASLDPRMTVFRIIAEPLKAHAYGDRAAIARRVAELIDAVGLPEDAASRYPSQFSGGQRQRIAIARAIALEPEMVIADEPVSALDVSIQAQIVNLLRDIQERMHIAYLVIAHDLALVHQIADRIIVMYLGRVVEEGSADAIIDAPQHPYTVALLSATPTPDSAGRPRLVLRGDPPSPIDRPSGCPFHPRCPIARERCAAETPPLTDSPTGGRVACFYPGELAPPWQAQSQQTTTREVAE